MKREGNQLAWFGENVWLEGQCEAWVECVCVWSGVEWSGVEVVVLSGLNKEMCCTVQQEMWCTGGRNTSLRHRHTLLFIIITVVICMDFTKEIHVHSDCLSTFPAVWFIFLTNKPPPRSFSVTHSLTHSLPCQTILLTKDSSICSVFYHLFYLWWRLLWRFRCFRSVLVAVKDLNYNE